ncbi:MAG: 3-keto-5-aminohexanoate cleavage protein [Lachnospiraceae bacterium]|nr:3-keto-5-aminohexanoate cleavage protein [Lachnospiraceae bacterium]
MNKLIVTFTPTGMLPQKDQTPYIPITPQEIISDVRKACSIGISCVHLHARDPQSGDPVWAKEYFEEIILGIRAFAPDLVVSVTTSGRFYNTFETRSDVLSLSGNAKPDLASLTLSSLNFNHTASLNEPSMILSLAKKMREQGIKPELEAFDAGMINYAKYLIRKDIITPPYFFSLMLGNITNAQANLLHAGIMLNDLPEDSIAIMGGIGSSQLQVNTLAIAMGYGVRVGLEDNIWLDNDRTILATNADYLIRIHSIASSIGRDICTPVELRKLLKLQPGFGKYGTEQ